ncbi:MAG: molybdopterin-dependent oxidoreductase, partial [Thermodesulfobacteriota bacterium]
NLTRANQIAFGVDTTPHYDIENADLILSFGADFLGTWVSPVHYAHGYGHMRQGRPGARGTVIQIEPRMSQTGANADRWIPVRPGSEGLLAMGIGAAIVEGGYYKGPDVHEWRAMLKGYHLEDIAHKTEVGEERIRELAREFATTRRSLAIGGEGAASCENGVSHLVAVNVLNHLGGNTGRKGGILPNPDTPLRGSSSFKGIGDLSMAASTSRLKTLILYNANPLFMIPKGMNLEGAFRKIPFITSFSPFMDESTGMADLILPTHTSLEDWGDDFTEPSVGYPVATIMQPVVSPFYNTKGAGDIFISLAKGVGGEVERALPWSDFPTFLKGAWKRLYRNYGGRKEATFNSFWREALARGGWWPSQRAASKRISLSARRVRGQLPSRPSRYDGDEKGYPFYLTLYPHIGYYDGRGANLPWLQELPDPMTSAVWGTWIEMNPKTAKGMGIKEGDVVTVESPHGAIAAPVYHYPAMRPDTVAVPIGQGHRSYGRYALGRGVSPIDLLPHKLDKQTGALPLNATRVKVTKGGKGAKLVKMEGSTNEFDRGIVKILTPEKFKKLREEI